MDDEARRPAPWSRREQIVILVLVGLLALGCAFGWADRAGWFRPRVQVIPSGDYQFRIDLNRATESELRLLRGIGPKRAQWIVDYRQAHGPFRSVDELKQVPGLKPLRIEDLRPYVKVKS